MKLRPKVFLAVLFTMMLMLAALSVWLFYQSVSFSREENAKTTQILSNMLQGWIVETQHLPDPELVAHLDEKMRRSLLFDTWVIVDERREPLRWNGPQREANAASADPLIQEVLASGAGEPRIIEDRVYMKLVLPTDAPIGVRTDLKAGLVPHFDWESSFWQLLASIVLATAVLTLSLYYLLERHVIRPLDSLGDASRRILGGDYSIGVEETDRKDEIATLVRTFNAMMTSLKEYRGDMEAKVAEAARAIQEAQHRLIVAQRLSATGQLAAGIAHEINNPLGGMLNAARALRRPELGANKQGEYVSLILDGLMRIQGTVKKVLQFSPRRVQPQELDLRDVVRRALDFVQHKLDAKAVRVVHDAPARLPSVFGEPGELQQVFLNLILNSLDAVRNSRGKIEIRYEVSPQELLISVEDNGCGMDATEVSRAFDLFYTTKPPGEGTGLGLAVVHNIITSHGGRIHLESQRDAGTKILVWLPTIPQRQSSR